MESVEKEYLRAHRSHDLAHILSRWRKVARAAGLVVETLEEDAGYPVVGMTNRKSGIGGPGLYLSAGIHGDEPGAVLGLLEWAEANRAVLRSRPVLILPCVNPWGLTHNTRGDSRGHDLNRRFERQGGAVVGAILDFLGDRQFAAAASLHEDYDANGAYLYELARRGEGIGEQLLDEVESEVPRQRGNVDGRRARRGLIRRAGNFEEILREIEGMPEAIHLYLNHARRAFTFETPSEFSLFRRVRAQVRFLEGVARRVEGE